MNFSLLFSIVSLYEFNVYFVIFTLFIATNNIYFLILFASLWSKQVPEKILKLIAPENINKRPQNAFNCDMINQGGAASSQRSGFPSGHSTIASMIATYFVYVFMTAQNKHIKSASKRLLIFSVFFAIMMPIVRYLNHCHTILQVISGVLVGVIWGTFFIIFEQNVLIKWKLYRDHRSQIWY